MNSLNVKQIDGGSRIKQGDVASRLAYALQDEEGAAITDLEGQEASVRLIHLDTVVWQTSVLVSDSAVAFQLDGSLPARIYQLEIVVAGYVFPSDRKTLLQVVPSASLPAGGIGLKASEQGLLSDRLRALEERLGEIEVSDIDRLFSRVATLEEAVLMASLGKRLRELEVIAKKVPDRMSVSFRKVSVDSSGEGWQAIHTISLDNGAVFQMNNSNYKGLKDMAEEEDKTLYQLLASIDKADVALADLSFLHSFYDVKIIKAVKEVRYYDWQAVAYSTYPSSNDKEVLKNLYALGLIGHEKVQGHGAVLLYDPHRVN